MKHTVATQSRVHLGSFASHAIKLVMDRQTGHSDGFALVTISEADESHKAIAQLDGGREHHDIARGPSSSTL